MPAAQIELVRFDALSVSLAKSFVLRRGQLDPQLTDDVARDLLLNFEDVLDISIVSLRPHLVSIAGIDQLSVDPHALTHSTDASLQDRLHVESLADLSHVQRLALERESGCARGDLERRNA